MYTIFLHSYQKYNLNTILIMSYCMIISIQLISELHRNMSLSNYSISSQSFFKYFFDQLFSIQRKGIRYCTHLIMPNMLADHPTLSFTLSLIISTIILSFECRFAIEHLFIFKTKDIYLITLKAGNLHLLK